jgi:Zn-dependent M32 family carboxypeptidase
MNEELKQWLKALIEEYGNLKNSAEMLAEALLMGEDEKAS